MKGRKRSGVRKKEKKKGGGKDSDLSEAAKLINALEKLKTDEKGFDYHLDLNEKGQISKIFWIDGDQKKALQLFGDFLLADTTFK